MLPRTSRPFRILRCRKGTGRFSRGAKSYAVFIMRQPRESRIDSNLSLAGDLIGCNVSCLNHGVRVDQRAGLYEHEPWCPYDVRAVRMCKSVWPIEAEATKAAPRHKCLLMKMLRFVIP